MPLPTTQRFLNTAHGDVNRPVTQVQLVLGNYFSRAAYAAAAASSGDASADYPAGGAIDGDRTEINVGAAATADNDLGKSSWRSSGVPDHGDTVTLTITLPQARTINRLKLYHLSAHGLKSFKLEWWTGATWTQFAATSDVGGAGVLFTTTGTLDVLDFPDVTTTQVKLTVTHTQVANDAANVVEIEAYRKLDITDRLKSVAVKRQRDFKLANPMAASVTIGVINDDRFFSINHVPTAAETAAGFVNGELQPGMGILVSLGFDYYGAAPEYVSTFVGTVDSISVSPGARGATLECRDGMKGLLNKVMYTKLKVGQSIDANLRYILNRANISNFEMSIDVVPIIVDYFFTENQDALSTVRDLSQASADALFYFSETGVATFRFYTASLQNQKIFTSKIDWDSGTKSFIDTTTIPGNMLVQFNEQVDTFGTLSGDWRSSGGLFSWGVAGNKLIEASAAFPIAGTLMRFCQGSLRFWQFDYTMSNHAIPMGGRGGLVFMTTQLNGFDNSPLNGYRLDIIPASGANASQLALRTLATGAISGTLATANYTEDTSAHTIRVERDYLNNIVITRDGTPMIAVQDSQYTLQVWTGFYAQATASDAGYTGPWISYGNFNYPPPTPPPLIGDWASPVIDTGTSTLSYGTLTATVIRNNATLTYYTASSADGVTFDAWVIVPSNGQINSVVRRYLMVRVTMDTGSYITADPQILDMTATWNIGGGVPKYAPSPSSFTFSFDSTMLDLTQTLSDDLAGDSAIINDATVQAQPLVLTGTDTDTVWQGTIGTPPTDISAAAPLAVFAGQTLVYSPVISGGMDVSRMAGGNPPAVAVAGATGAAGTWGFASIHPTRPVLVLHVTASGTITDLRIVGKRFSSASYLQAQQAVDAASIARYDGRPISLSNPWIVSTSVAASIAGIIVANFKSPVSYIPSCSVRPMWSAQIGDRVTVNDINLDLTADYVIVGVDHRLSVDANAGEAQSELTLLKVPAGL